MGIHHITLIVGHPQENVDFYAGVLGLRLVKQTVDELFKWKSRPKGLNIC